eukprot:413799_1
MDSYVNRIMSVIQYQPLFKINDDITKISRYILGGAKLINILIKSHAARVPFQMDLFIAVKQVDSVTNTASAAQLDDDIDEEPEEPEEEDSSSEEEEEKRIDESIKIGNIESKLKGSYCGYHKFELSELKEESYQRSLNDGYRDFREKLRKKSKKLCVAR